MGPITPSQIDRRVSAALQDIAAKEPDRYRAIVEPLRAKLDELLVQAEPHNLEDLEDLEQLEHLEPDDAKRLADMRAAIERLRQDPAYRAAVRAALFLNGTQPGQRAAGPLLEPKLLLVSERKPRATKRAGTTTPAGE